MLLQTAKSCCWKSPDCDLCLKWRCTGIDLTNNALSTGLVWGAVLSKMFRIFRLMYKAAGVRGSQKEPRLKHQTEGCLTDYFEAKSPGEINPNQVLGKGATQNITSKNKVTSSWCNHRSDMLTRQSDKPSFHQPSVQILLIHDAQPCSCPHIYIFTCWGHANVLFALVHIMWQNVASNIFTLTSCHSTPNWNHKQLFICTTFLL